MNEQRKWRKEEEREREKKQDNDGDNIDDKEKCSQFRFYFRLVICFSIRGGGNDSARDSNIGIDNGSDVVSDSSNDSDDDDYSDAAASTKDS